MSFLTRFLPRRRQWPPPIALLTDFGLSDQYVGTMKGVIAAINPRTRVIDLSHTVAPQRTRQGAYLLWASYRFFPEGTIFCAVVDPGVGSRRRILAVKTRRAVFLAPDNGILDFVLGDERVHSCVEVQVDKSRYVLTDLSATFHGRDVFAPVAAYLSGGVELGQVGTAILPPSPRNLFVKQKGSRESVVLHIDTFGNVISNIRMTNARASVQSLSVKKSVVAMWVENYRDAPAKRPCLIQGSSGLVEIVVKNASAAKLLKVAVDAELKIRWK
ncbi:MAG: SAM-dependent chlorinase/fluorinase [Ignavibacteriales bacterium]|nr:SAM-dependent chlorinase/fluorinase [Ignavibacteriales bacterium]